MARIDRAEHPRILHLVDVEQRRVSEVAAEYGCTTANIYALLNKLRRSTTPAPAPDRPAPIPDAAVAAPAPVPALPAEEADASSDLFAAAAPPAPSNPEPAPPAIPVVPVPVPVPVPPSAPSPSRHDADRSAVGARLARPGIGLAMRTADGEETTAPFRSLDDLLSAIKPILRNAARSPDPVWFSIQPVDLAEHDDL